MNAKDQSEAGQGAGDASAMLKYMGTELNKARELMMSARGTEALDTDERGLMALDWLRTKANSIEGGTSEIMLTIISRVSWDCRLGTVQMLVYTDEETLCDTVQAMLAAASPVSTFRALRDKGETQNPALWSEMAELGLAGVLVPEEAGGSGMGVTAASLIGTALGQNLAITPFISTSVIAATALKTASADLHKESLEQISQGKLTYALALDEGQKFNPSHIETRAAW